MPWGSGKKKKKKEGKKEQDYPLEVKLESINM